MVLAILVIASTVLAATIRRSSREVMDAGTAMQNLQLRWGTLSLRQLCMASPQSELVAPESGEPLPCLHKTLKLGNLSFHLVLADEQAKANVNMLAARYGDSDALSILTRLQAQLRPIAYAQGSGAGRIRQSWHEVFEYRHPRELVDWAGLQPSISDRVTCWGSGRVNFKTASSEILQTTLADVLSEADIAKVHELTVARPSCTLEEVFGLLQLTAQDAAKVRSVLTDRSDCFSLWVIAQGPTRSWYRLYVRNRMAAESDAQTWAFEW